MTIRISGTMLLAGVDSDGVTRLLQVNSDGSLVSTAPEGSAGGDLAGTYPNPTLAPSGVTAGTYGSATDVPVLAIDSKGRVTSAVNTAIAIAASQVVSGELATARLGTGVPGTNTVLRGDGIWANHLLTSAFGISPSPAPAGFPGFPLHIIGTSTTQVAVDRYSGGAGITIRSANGTSAAPTATLLDDTIANLRQAGYTGSAFGAGQTFLNIIAAENWSGTNQGAYITFRPTSIAATASTARIAIDSAGHLAIGGAQALGWTANTLTVTNGLAVLQVALYRDATGVLALRNSTAAQTFRIYNTYTDASNYERGYVTWSGNVLQIGTENAGTGTARAMYLSVAGNNALTIITNGTGRWIFSGVGNFIAYADNSYDIGASGANRPRSIYAGTSFLGPDGAVGAPTYSVASETNTGMYRPGVGAIGFAVTGNSVAYMETNKFVVRSNASYGWSPTTTAYSGTPDLLIGRAAAAVLRIGNSAGGTPVANTLQIGEDSRAGTDSNVGGANGTIRSGLGTGTGTASTLIFQTPTLAGSGTGAQTYTTQLTLSDTSATFTRGLVLPAGNATVPAIAFSGATNSGLYWAGSTLAYTNAGAAVTFIGASIIFSSGGALQWNSGVQLNGTTDVTLARDAADTLALRRSTNPQTLRIYNTHTDGSNYERAFIRFTSNVLEIGAEAAGTGTARDVRIIAGTNAAITFYTGGTARWNIASTTGHIWANTDNTYDIGLASFRPRSIYAGTSFLAPDGAVGAPGFAFASALTTGIYLSGSTLRFAASGILALSVSGAGTIQIVPSAAVLVFSDTSVRRLIVNSLMIGGVDSATPVAHLLTIGENSRAGTDSNVAGANGTLRSGLGTGTGTPSALILQSPVTVASGTGAQTYTEGLRVQGVGTAIGLGFFGHAASVRASAYTPTNVVTDRSYDANATTVDELADVLGTLIADLQSYGLLQ